MFQKLLDSIQFITGIREELNCPRFGGCLSKIMCSSERSIQEMSRERRGVDRVAGSPSV
jgi:hypothetical protein